MHFTDDAILLSTRKFGENSAIVTVLSAEHGRVSGVCKAAFSSKSRGVFQPGNKLHIHWSSRLAENLGTLTAELTESVTAYVMDSRSKLAALASACSLVEKTLSERDPMPQLYEEMNGWVDRLKSDDDWLKHYVLLELAVLTHTGFGLDFSQCVATGGTDNLTYVSPKSGCAVSTEAGLPYHDKMLPLPPFLLKNEGLCAPEPHQIIDAMALTGYFLERRVFEMHTGKLPAARQEFLRLISVTRPASKELELHGA